MHCKSSFGSFSDFPRHPRAMKAFQVDCCVFLGTLFPENLVKPCLPSTERTFTPQCSHLHGLQVLSTLFRKSQQKSLQISPHTRTEPIPNTYGGQEYPALMFCYTEGTILRRFFLQGFVFLEQSVQNSKLKAFWTSRITGRWLEVPHSKPIPHFLKFNFSLLQGHFNSGISFCLENPSWTSAWTFPSKFLQEQYWKELQVGGMRKMYLDFFNNNSSRKTKMWVRSQWRILKAHTLHLPCPSI